jgi:hypothetical protein
MMMLFYGNAKVLSLEMLLNLNYCPVLRYQSPHISEWLRIRICVSVIIYLSASTADVLMFMERVELAPRRLSFNFHQFIYTFLAYQIIKVLGAETRSIIFPLALDLLMHFRQESEFFVPK